jgi:hypothetical protein
MLGPFVRLVTVDPCCLLALAILALSSELMLWTLWFLAEILCDTCSNRSTCGGHVVVPLLHRLKGSRGRGLPILSLLGQP